MELKFQQHAIEELKLAATFNKQSIIISGDKGTGKTYLAKLYAGFIKCENFITLNSSINDIREAMSEVYDTKDKVVVCFENLDKAMLSSSYALLKFLEEPKSNVYVIITSRKLHYLPDTIISRSNVISIAHPTKIDIDEYAKSIDNTKYHLLCNQPIWKGATSLSYVKKIFDMTIEEIEYYETSHSILKSNKCISTLSWDISHFKHNNQQCDIQFLINYIINTTFDARIKRHAISFMNDLEYLKIAQHALLIKFLFDCKYTS